MYAVILTAELVGTVSASLQGRNGREGGGSAGGGAIALAKLKINETLFNYLGRHQSAIDVRGIPDCRNRGYHHSLIHTGDLQTAITRMY